MSAEEREFNKKSGHWKDSTAKKQAPGAEGQEVDEDQEDMDESSTKLGQSANDENDEKVIYENNPVF